jgi:CSLREA domain-containing protein
MLLPGWARRIRVIGISIVASLLLAPCAWAQVTFTVNTTDDGVDISPGDGNCSTVALPAPPNCTLRAAIMEANRAPALAGGATIILHASASPYRLQIYPTIADGEADGDLNLIVPAGYNPPGPTKIMGDGAANTTIDAKKLDRIFRIDAGRTLSISGVALINGISDAGGAIYSSGSLSIDFSVLSGNIATENGGAIAIVDGMLSLRHSTLNDNHADSQGGALYLFASLGTTTANVERSTLSRNSAGYGGAVAGGDAELDISNSTIGQNSASDNGGGIYNYGVVKMYNSTVAYNLADSDGDSVGDGAGVFNGAGRTFEVHNSLLAGNRLVFDNSNSDCYGFLVLYGVTGFEGGQQCSGFGSVIFVDSATELGTLKNNGGPTETIALLPTTTLIGNGAADECKDDAGHYLTSDQRGNPRPPAGTTCDIGAFEYNELFRSSFDPPIP